MYLEEYPNKSTTILVFYSILFLRQGTDTMEYAIPLTLINYAL